MASLALRPSGVAADSRRGGVRCAAVGGGTGRRALLLGSAGAALLGLAARAQAAAEPAGKEAPAPPIAISIAPLNAAAKRSLDRRDEAMDFACKGGMFDCDGDRSEFAHKQYADWLASGGVPKRIRDGNPRGPRSY
ncbi:hypothetical protein HT031_006714 [Scenedesmus sp. PABB004]|nr:hypothetical protein HT031_006714 [Scenedesmus sp. PABB004]